MAKPYILLIVIFIILANFTSSSMTINSESMLYSKYINAQTMNLTMNLKTPSWWPNRQITLLMRMRTRVLIEYSPYSLYIRAR